MNKARHPELPRPFPGCWKDREWKREYKSAYMRIVRRGPYRDEERAAASISAKFRVRGVTKCFWCGDPARRFALRKALIDDKWTWVAVRWCGKC